MEFDYHPASVADPDARLFRRDGKLYRGIKGDRAELYRELCESGLFQELALTHGLISTCVTADQVPGYTLTLIHAEVPFVSYPCEWCAAMLKRAALRIIDLQMTLTRRDLELQDAHPWNVLFDSTRAVYVDVGSIVPRTTDTWPAIGQFRRWVLNPLKAMAVGEDALARRVLHPTTSGLSDALVSSITLSHTLKHPRRVLGVLGRAWRKAYTTSRHRRISGPVKLTRRMRSLEHLRAEIESTALPVESTDSKGELSMPACDRLPFRMDSGALEEILSIAKPRTVLDLVGRDGTLACQVAQRDIQVVAMDYEEACVAQMDGNALKRDLKILALVGDLRYPTPASGIGYQVYRSAVDRLQCDLVLAIGLLPRLALRYSLRFDQIVPAVLQFARQFAVVEFVGAEDPCARGWYRPHFEGYSEENFRSCLERYCKILKVYRGRQSDHVLFFCRVGTATTCNA